jgi:phosphatidate cytidylyltransferase
MLRERLYTAIGLAAVLLAVLFLAPPWATGLLLTAAIIAGAWEWSAFVTGATSRRLLYVGLIALLIATTWILARDPRIEQALLLLAVGWWVGALGWVLLAPRRSSRAGAALAGVLVLVPAWLALMHLRLDVERGAEWILFLLLLVAAADTGAFFAGRRFGRVPLAPRVSPNKTWEGVFGGFALLAAVALAGAYYFRLPVAPVLGLCMAVFVFSVVGDLVESLFKRASGLKDSGSMLPGHGGVLDRIDSLTAAAPAMAEGVRLLGVAG